MNLETSSTAPAVSPPQVIKRWGGRHMIFRNRVAGTRWIPHAYALISNFGGPVWFFYGLGQLWLTHRKVADFAGWTARVPRLGGASLADSLEALRPELTAFAEVCNEHGIEGTLVVEPQLLEFHWTFGYELDLEKEKPSHLSPLDAAFEQLATAFAERPATKPDSPASSAT